MLPVILLCAIALPKPALAASVASPRQLSECDPSDDNCDPNYCECNQTHYYYYGGGGAGFFALGVCLCCRKRRRDGTYGGCCSRCQDDEPPTSTLRAPLTNNRRVQASSTTNNHRAQAPSGINTCVQHLAPAPLPIAPMPPPLVQGIAVAGPSAQSVGEPTNQSAGGDLALSVARALNMPPEEARGKLQRLNDKEKAAVAAKHYLEAGQVRTNMRLPIQGSNASLCGA